MYRKVFDKVKVKKQQFNGKRGELPLPIVNRGLSSFEERSYGGVELEELGRNIVEHILRHIGMVRYEKSGIRVFDISDRDVGRLVDSMIEVNRGVDKNVGIQEYQKSIRKMLDVIGDLQGEGVTGSIVTSLRMIILDEIQLFKKQHINFDDLWEL